MRASAGRITCPLRRDLQYSLLATSAKCERKGLSAGIKELDLRGAHLWTPQNVEFFPIIAIAAKAVTIPKGRFTSSR